MQVFRVDILRVKLLYPVYNVAYLLEKELAPLLFFRFTFFFSRYTLLNEL